MAAYPFDKKFISTVEQFFGEESRWVFSELSRGAGNVDGVHAEQWLVKLNNAGYDRTILKSYFVELSQMELSDLFELAVSDSDTLSPARIFLENKNSRDVFEMLGRLCFDEDPLRRTVAVEILMRSPGLAFKSEAQKIVRKLAGTETDEKVRGAIAYAMCHLRVKTRAKYLTHWATSSEADTRLGIAYSLGGENGEEAIKCLIKLTQDTDDEVRDWATFGLGDTGDKDSPEIREALYARLSRPSRRNKI